MSKARYHQIQRRRDEEALYGKKQDPRTLKDLPLEDIFFIVTRDSVDLLNSMFQQSIKSAVTDVIEEVVEKALDQKLREVAVGITKGLQEAGPQQQIPTLSQLAAIYPFPQEVKAKRVKGKKSRKGEWTPEEDELVKETVLRFAREGKSQNKALDHLAEVMTERTRSAINFRFYDILRKQISTELHQIKQQRRKR